MGQVGQIAAPEVDLVGGEFVKADEGAVVGGAGRGGDGAAQVLEAEEADEAGGGLHGPDLTGEAGHRAGSDAAAQGGQLAGRFLGLDQPAVRDVVRLKEPLPSKHPGGAGGAGGGNRGTNVSLFFREMHMSNS